jgi:ABC-type polysaccharide/polyol phosphate export permease
VLGPFWLTLSMGTMVATLGIVFSSLFHHSESLISEFCSRRVLMQHGVLQSAS